MTSDPPGDAPEIDDARVKAIEGRLDTIEHTVANLQIPSSGPVAGPVLLELIAFQAGLTTLAERVTKLIQAATT